MSAPAVLLVDCPKGLQEPLRRALTDQGMLDAGQLHVAPQVVLVWLDPHAADAETRVSELRDRHRRSSPAIVGVSAAADAPALVRAAETGLDDLLPDAADPAQIAARAWLICGSRTRFAQASPLTGLPGAGALEREISRRLPQRGQMALLAFDVDFFKSYNDRYGYRRGDDLLRYAWCVIEQALQAADGAFLAHLGGDDFFALVRPAEAEAVAQRAVELFAAGRAEYYDAADLARGAVFVRTRTGELRQVPLVTLTVACVTNEPEDLQHSGQLAAVLAELKAYGKRLGGGRFVADRRRVHDGEAAWVLRQQQGRGTER
ncbi:diguanylate cyclase [bacterium]|nr:diguanylate cyclase [bacterium]